MENIQNQQRRPWLAIAYFIYSAVTGFIGLFSLPESAGDAPIEAATAMIFLYTVVAPITLSILLLIGKRGALLILLLHFHASYLVTAAVGNIAILILIGNSALNIIATLIDVVASVALFYSLMLYIAANAFHIGYIHERKQLLVKIVTICYAFRIIIYIISTVSAIITLNSFIDGIVSMAPKLTWFVGIASLGVWVFGYESGSTEECEQVSDPDDKNYISLGKHILLTLFTLGIWRLFWTYKTTDYTNNSEYEDSRNPAVCLMCCMFVPFYHIYWAYKTAERIDMIARQNGVDSNIAKSCLVFSLGSPLALCTVMQGKINQIILNKNNFQENYTADIQPL